MSKVTKTFSLETGLTNSWTAPAGITQVKVNIFKSPIRHNGSGGTTRGELILNGDAYCWGDNVNGQVGDGASVTSKSSPILVVGGVKFLQLSVAEKHCIGLDYLGRAWTWGFNANGQLGDATVVAKSSPVLVGGNLTFKHVVASGGANTGSSAGITTDGRLFTWGVNLNGQLGDASVVPKSSPVLVVGNLKFKDVCVSTNQHMIGLTEQGVAYAWGGNLSGQLGDASVVSKSSPIAVSGALVFQSIYGSGATSAGLTTAGALYTWGDNVRGKLGDGTITDRSSPVAVVGGLVFKSAIVNARSMAALDSSGNAYGWGANPKGQVGDGTVTNKSSPVAVVGGLTFDSLGSCTSNGSDNGSFFAITRAGAMYAWGDNGAGQLGDNSVVSKSSPVLVSGGLVFSGWSALPAGTKHITVVPNTTYTIDFTTPTPSFAGVALGIDVNKIEIKY